MTTCYHLDTLTPRQSRIFYTASYFDLQQSIHNSSPTKIYEYVPSIQVILSATIFCIFLPASLSSQRRRFDSFPTTIYASSGHDDPSPVRLRRYFIRSVSSPFLYESNSPIIPPSLNFSRSIQTHFDSVALLLFIRLPFFRR